MSKRVKKTDIKLLVKDSLLAIVHNSVGSQAYRTFYALVNDKKKDIIEDGRLACAFFVSFVLHNLRLISEPHMTVAGTEKDLKKSGWKKRLPDEIQPGDVIVWEEESGHQHIGFYIGRKRAVSTSSTKKVVDRHHFTFNGQRAIESVYTNVQTN